MAAEYVLGLEGGVLGSGPECEASSAEVADVVAELAAALEEEATVEPRWICLWGLRCLGGAMPGERSC